MTIKKVLETEFGRGVCRVKAGLTIDPLPRWRSDMRLFHARDGDKSRRDDQSSGRVVRGHVQQVGLRGQVRHAIYSRDGMHEFQSDADGMAREWVEEYCDFNSLKSVVKIM